MRLLNKLVQVGDVVARRGGLNALLNWRPRSLASFQLVSSLLDDGLSFRTIIDGGANVGQFARAASWAFPEATIYSFEPQSDVAEQCQKNLADKPLVNVICCALGESEGSVEFHRQADSQCSSVLPPADMEDQRFRSGHRTEQVKLVRLDTYFQEIKLADPLLLKLDLQGFEMAALRGAPKILSQASHVLLETAFSEAYRGESLFGDIWKFFDQAGFRYVRPIAFSRDEKNRIYQTDSLFARK